MKRILILHRNRLFRDCLSNYLQSVRNDDAISFDHEHVKDVDDIVCDDFDLVLLDLNLPGELAIQLVRALSFRTVKTLLLVPSDHQSLVGCITEGVDGCVLEQSTLQKLNLAIESVLTGEKFWCSDFVNTMIAELSQIRKAPAWQMPDSETTFRLTSRERQVLELIAKRQCNKEIAKALSLSLFTIKNHVHSILKKLNVENRLEAVELAQHENLLNRR
jgi:DNA-binding NarL/FixJ family response regulator